MGVDELAKAALSRCAYQRYPIQIRLSAGWNQKPTNPIEDLEEFARREAKLQAKLENPKGCEIYERRPQSCRDFECYWRVGYMSPDERPDKLGAMLTPFHAEDEETGETWIGLRAIEVYEGSFNRARGYLALLARNSPMMVQLRAGDAFETFEFNGKTLSPWPYTLRKEVITKGKT